MSSWEERLYKLEHVRILFAAHYRNQGLLSRIGRLLIGGIPL